MKLFYCSVLIGACAMAPAAYATLVDGAAQPLVIAPSDFPTTDDGNVNPTYNYPGVPGYGSLSVSYAAYFDGQTASDPSSPPISVSGPPTGPLTLASGAPDLETIVELDGTNNKEVLGGVPAGFGITNGFGGSIAILFSTPVQGVQLIAGYLDSVGAAEIQAYTANGTSLGDVTNTGTGYETFNLSDSGGSLISGLLLTSTDAGGFGIDNVGVMQQAQVSTPAPGALAVLPGLAVAFMARRKARRGAVAA